MTVKAIPEGFHSLTPYLIVQGAKGAIDFYQKAFNAVVRLELNTPDGCIAHAELKIGNFYLMLSEEYPNMGFVGLQTLGGAGINIMLYSEEAESLYEQAIEQGCEVLRPMMEQFYGDKAGTLKDPYGHVWTIGMHVEDLSEEELAKRMVECME